MRLLLATTPRLDVRLGDGSRPSKATLDGSVVDLGPEPLPVDPGVHHLVVVRNADHAPFERDVVLLQ